MEKSISTIRARGTAVNQFFEKKYEEFAINHDLTEEVKAKLENRREGVRLSVKSVSRLMRKLNPEKPLEDHTEAFISFSEEMSEKIRQVSAQYSAQEEHLSGETVTEGSRLEEENKVTEDSGNIDAGEADTILQVSNKEGTHESLDEIFIIEEKSAEPLFEKTVDQTAEQNARTRSVPGKFEATERANYVDSRGFCEQPGSSTTD